MSYKAPPGYALFNTGEIKEGDFFWTGFRWKETKARIGKMAQDYEAPHARRIGPPDPLQDKPTGTDDHW